MFHKTRGGYASKLDLYEYSPFYETIFIDADCTIIRDISPWFALFQDAGKDMNVFGRAINIAEMSKDNRQLSKRAIEKYSLTKYILFNGGCYYFKKTRLAEKVFSRAKELVDSYIDDELPLMPNGLPQDEPVFMIAMIENQIYGVSAPEGLAMCFAACMTKIHIDVLHGVCEFWKFGYSNHPACMHWGTGNTYEPVYKREAKKAYYRFNGYPMLLAELVPQIIYSMKVCVNAIRKVIKNKGAQ